MNAIIHDDALEGDIRCVVMELRQRSQLPRYLHRVRHGYVVFRYLQNKYAVKALFGEVAEKNLRLNEKLTHMGQRTTRAKLMSYFSAEAQRRGGYEFDIPFSRQQLADYLGVERSGLSLELGKMRDEGLLDFHKSHFLLKTPESDSVSSYNLI